MRKYVYPSKRKKKEKKINLCNKYERKVYECKREATVDEGEKKAAMRRSDREEGEINS